MYYRTISIRKCRDRARPPRREVARARASLTSSRFSRARLPPPKITTTTTPRTVRYVASALHAGDAMNTGLGRRPARRSARSRTFNAVVQRRSRGGKRCFCIRSGVSGARHTLARTSYALARSPGAIRVDGGERAVAVAAYGASRRRSPPDVFRISPTKRWFHSVLRRRSTTRRTKKRIRKDTLARGFTRRGASVDVTDVHAIPGAPRRVRVSAAFALRPDPSPKAARPPHRRLRRRSASTRSTASFTQVLESARAKSHAAKRSSRARSGARCVTSARERDPFALSRRVGV